jgi:hypothetical protein
VSRSASRSQSRAGERRRFRPSEDGSGDEEEDEGEEDEEGLTAGVGGPRKRASSRASSTTPASRRSSINLGSPHPNLHSLVRENTSGGVAAASGAATATTSRENLASRENLGDDRDDGARDRNRDGKSVEKEASQSGWPRTFKPLMTPRVLSTEMEEEPFLDTAPNSPLPKRTRTHDSFSSGLQGVDVFEEGERVGVDVWLEGRGGWVRDCFADSSEGGPGNGIGGPRELEVERRLGEGTYAM